MAAGCASLAALQATYEEDDDEDEGSASAGPAVDVQATLPAVHTAPDVDIAFEVRA